MDWKEFTMVGGTRITLNMRRLIGVTEGGGSLPRAVLLLNSGSKIELETSYREFTKTHCKPPLRLEDCIQPCISNPVAEPILRGPGPKRKG